MGQGELVNLTIIREQPAPVIPIMIVHRRLAPPFDPATVIVEPNQPVKAKDFGEWPSYQGGEIKKAADGKYGGLVVAFTDSNKRDLQGEWFDEHTDFMSGVYPVKGIKALYDHGFDASIGAIPIGEITEVQYSKEGIWATFNMDFAKNLKLYLTDLEAPEDWKKQQLAKAERYHALIQQMLDSGELGWSSGAHPQSVRVAKSGHIERWPIWEASATVRPAMPFGTRIQRVKSNESSRSLSVDLFGPR